MSEICFRKHTPEYAGRTGVWVTYLYTLEPIAQSIHTTSEKALAYARAQHHPGDLREEVVFWPGGMSLGQAIEWWDNDPLEAFRKREARWLRHYYEGLFRYQSVPDTRADSIRYVDLDKDAEECRGNNDPKPSKPEGDDPRSGNQWGVHYVAGEKHGKKRPWWRFW